MGDEETAAHASDTLARNLMKNGEQNFEINFSDNDAEVYPGRSSSRYIGVSYSKVTRQWQVKRWSKSEKKQAHNGWYRDENTAAHASDSLARTLMASGEQNHKLNFPDDIREVFPEKKRRPPSILACIATSQTQSGAL